MAVNLHIRAIELDAPYYSNYIAAAVHLHNPLNNLANRCESGSFYECKHIQKGYI